MNTESVNAYGSCSLNETEQRYSKTEREALTVVWACEHFHLYVYGSPFTIVTDHKALEAIYNNPRSKTLHALNGSVYICSHMIVLLCITVVKAILQTT